MKSVGLMIVVAWLAVSAGASAAEPVSNVFESSSALVPTTQIDKLVFSQLKSLRIQPVLCSDAVFIRRVYLDVIGTLPTAAEAQAFILDPDTSNKRRVVIDQLLERPEYADYWSMKWGDILRIKAEFPVNLWPNAAQAYHHWLRAALVENLPYDKFVREILTASGSNFRVGPVNFYRAIQNRTPDGIAGAVALTFMGARTDAWPTNAGAGLAAFFAQVGYKPTQEWKEEHVFWDPLKVAAWGTSNQTVVGTPPTNRPPSVAIFPDGTRIKLPADRDPREVFADWLITPKNPWFKRAIVNRIWDWLMGRGIIHETDDIRPDNPPSNPALLTYLEKELVAGHYDLKRMYRLILNSQTYQLSSLTQSNPLPPAVSYACYGLRRLDAEVLIDAINKITGMTDLYTSPIPEPFTYIPDDMPAIGIGDGSITSPFLTLFGRSARVTGMESERINKPVSAQWLHLLNSSHIQRKLEQGPKLKAIFESSRKPAEIITNLYLAILARYPTPSELKNAEMYGTPGPPPKSGGPAPIVKRREDWVDLSWALINSVEFLYRH